MKKNTPNQQTQKVVYLRRSSKLTNSRSSTKNPTTNWYLMVNNDTTLSSGTKLGFILSLLFDTVHDVSAKELRQGKETKRNHQLAKRRIRIHS